MEVHFVDVGLGTCQIIHLGNRRAIVIDCGVKSDEVAAKTLRHLGIDRIERLITSHSDNDHIGGAPTILNDYQSRIDEILAVQDHKWLGTKYWQRIEYFIEQGALDPSAVKRLELNENQKPRLIWSNSQGSRLRMLSPTFVRNLKAQKQKTSNGTSAVFILDHCGHRVVFAGDSEMPQWKEIYAERQKRGYGTLRCDVLAVPHHGGLLDGMDAEMDWLYDEVIRSDYAVLSVGTVKKPDHPRPDVIARLLSAGSKVICTELTGMCHKSPLSQLPSVVRPLTLVGRAAMDAKRKRPRCVACAGTIAATLNDAGCEIQRFDEHQRAVDQLAASSDGHPMCRN